MYQANIENSAVVNEKLIAHIIYFDGVNKFAEDMDVTGANLETFNNKVTARLNTLNVNQDTNIKIPLGLFTPTVSTPTPLQDFLTKYHTLQSLQNLVNLGIIPNTDSNYLKALSNAQTAFDPTFIGQF